MERTALIRGALLILASELAFASMGAVVKAASVSLPNEQLVFFRNLFGLVALLPFLLRTRGDSLATRRYPLHLLRAALGVSAMYAFFWVLGNLPLAEAVLLKMTAPIFLPLIGWLWLREHVSSLAMVAIPVGFLGVLLVLDPAGNFSWMALVGLLGGLLAAGAKVAVRRLTATEPPGRVVFYFAVNAGLLTTLPMIWAWQTPTPAQWGWLALLGLFGTAGQLLMTRGYAEAPAGQLGPFTYFTVLFAGVYGYLFWGEVPTAGFLAGAVLIAAAGLLAVWKRRPSPARR